MAAESNDKPLLRRSRGEAKFIKVVAGGRRAALEALRDKLAAELVRETGFHASGLSRELRAVLVELDNLPIDSGAEVSRVDQIADGIADELAQRRQRQVRGPAAASS